MGPGSPAWTDTIFKFRDANGHPASWTTSLKSHYGLGFRLSELGVHRLGILAILRHARSAPAMTRIDGGDQQFWSPGICVGGQHPGIAHLEMLVYMWGREGTAAQRSV